MLRLDIELRRGHFHRHVRIDDDARVIALVGRSGAGKTSVLNAIAGLVTPVAGRIEIDGRCLFDSAQRIDEPVHRRRVGYVFQDARLFPHLDVRRNLLYGRHGGRGAPRFGFDAVVELLGIAPLLPRRTRNLSGGEAQRVAIGRALLSQPSLFDPTRAPAGSHTLWTYTHVPAGSSEDRSDAVIAQIERFAPGFRDTILAVSSRSAVDLERHNPNYPGGDIAAGAPDLGQLVRRPVISGKPWRTPVPGLYLCSASAAPGPGVHGLVGWQAALCALRDRFDIDDGPDLSVAAGRQAVR